MDYDSRPLYCLNFTYNISKVQNQIKSTVSSFHILYENLKPLICVLWCFLYGVV